MENPLPETCEVFWRWGILCNDSTAAISILDSSRPVVSYSASSLYSLMSWFPGVNFSDSVFSAYCVYAHVSPLGKETLPTVADWLWRASSLSRTISPCYSKYEFSSVDEPLSLTLFCDDSSERWVSRHMPRRVSASSNCLEAFIFVFTNFFMVDSSSQFLISLLLCG